MTSFNSKLNEQPWKDQSWIFSDRPIKSLSHDLLWGNEETIKVQIDHIANHIAGAVSINNLVANGASSALGSTEARQSGNSLTFAIHGRWGSGKTSFVGLVLSQIRELLGSDRAQLLECHYQASAFVGSTLGAKASLARQMLLTLAGGNRKRAIKIFKEQFEQTYDSSSDGSIDKAYEDFEAGHLSVGKLIALESEHLEKISELNTLVDFGDIIRTELSPQGVTEPGQCRTMIVVLDDLDRCPPDFVSSILASIQQWSSVDSLYFILSIDKDVLKAAVEQQHRMDAVSQLTPFSPSVALEKYVQYSVDIPELSDQQVRKFIDRFLEHDRDRTLRFFKDNSDLIAKSVEVCTPRSIKKCLNTIRADLNQVLRSSSTSTQTENQHNETADSSSKAQDQEKAFEGEDGPRLRLKEKLLEYSWKDFYQNFYLRGRNKKKRNLFSLAFLAIEQACYTYDRDGGDREQLEFSLNRIRKTLNLPNEALPSDHRFVSFLGSKPWFSLTEDLSRISLQAILQGLIPEDQPEETVISATELLSQKSPIKKVEEYSERAREASLKGDYSTIIECAIESFQLAETQLSSFTSAEVHDFGNIALYVESVATNTGNPKIQELSLALFNIAYRLNPKHVNNNLNLVSFVLDARYPRLVENLASYCYELLADESLYENSGQFSRYLTYKARFDIATSGPDSGWRWIDKILDLIREGKEQDTIFRRLISFYNSVDPDSTYYSYLKEAARILMPRLQGNEREVAFLLYADRLSRNITDSEHIDVKEAFECYKHILRPVEQGGIQDTPGNNYRGNAYHNFAVGLKRVGYLEAAGQCWYQSYQLLRNENSGNLIPAYTRYLKEECDRPDLAEVVEQQAALTEIALPVRESRPLPEHLIEGGIQAIFDI